MGIDKEVKVVVTGEPSAYIALKINKINNNRQNAVTQSQSTVCIRKLKSIVLGSFDSPVTG